MGKSGYGEALVTGRGNLRVCVATLLGEVVSDLTQAELAYHDPAFPLLACGIAYRAHGR